MLSIICQKEKRSVEAASPVAGLGSDSLLILCQILLLSLASCKHHSSLLLLVYRFNTCIKNILYTYFYFVSNLDFFFINKIFLVNWFLSCLFWRLKFGYISPFSFFLPNPPINSPNIPTISWPFFHLLLHEYMPAVKLSSFWHKQIRGHSYTSASIQ